MVSLRAPIWIDAGHVVHFTYSDGEDYGDLQQGDLLRKTDELAKAVGELHPHFVGSDYVAYFILTQTCDLVRSDSRLSIPFVNLCPVRRLDDAVAIELSKHQKNPVLIAGNALNQRGSVQVGQFIERVLKNNEEQYFYLHTEPMIGVVEPLCAFLRQPFSVDVSKYDVCLAARMASLKPEFQAKLGWNIGRLYNRVATVDWVPIEDLKKLVDQIKAQSFIECDDRQVKSVLDSVAPEDLEKLSIEEARKLISNAPVRKKKDEVIEAVLSTLLGNGVVDAGKTELARKLLTNNPGLSSLLKN